MGFPAELLLPKLLLHALTFLILVRKLILSAFRVLGLSDLVDPESSVPIRPDPTSLSASLVRDLLPVVKFSDLVGPPESCAVCLCEFDGRDEIRELANCRHVFHRGCLDRWMDHDQRTCPLCRTQVVPDELWEGFNQRLWAGPGIGDFSRISSGW